MEFQRHLTRTSANTRSTPKFDTLGEAREDKLWQTLGKFSYPKYYKHSILHCCSFVLAGVKKASTNVRCFSKIADTFRTAQSAQQQVQDLFEFS